ncbi:MAG: Thioredoxin domain-containing protein 9 [Paramarteilia canceri]
MSQSAQASSQLQAILGNVERAVDEQINRLDSLDENELNEIRNRRARQLRAEQQKKEEFLFRGHGKLTELNSEKDVFDIYKESDNIICLFYADDQQRIARQAPFLCSKLPFTSKIQLVFIKEGGIMKYLDCVPLLSDTENMTCRIEKLSKMFIELQKHTKKLDD